MNYYLCSGAFGNVFAVPKSVVDNYIKLANEASIKVLLYMLRNNEQEHGSKDISAALNISESQVEEAFVFWENANIFQKTNSSEIVIEKNNKEAVAPKKTIVGDRRDYNLNPSEIAERVEKSEYIKGMFTMSEQTFGRPLTHNEQRSFIWMHDYLGLNTEVILMITAYCVSQDKGGIKYIETVASDWAERGINTLELAQSEIKILEEKSSYNGKIMKTFGMNRKPTPKQQELIDKWQDRGYDMELIKYAYEKTIDKIDKLNFPYINGILENWYSKKLLTKADVINDEKNSSAKNSKNLKEYSFDLDDYKSLVNDFGD